MRFKDYEESLDNYCRRKNIHVVCLACSKFCSQKWSRWTGSMPPQEYCENYIEDPLWNMFYKILNEVLEE